MTSHMKKSERAQKLTFEPWFHTLRQPRQLSGLPIPHLPSGGNNRSLLTSLGFL